MLQYPGQPPTPKCLASKATSVAVRRPFIMMTHISEFQTIIELLFLQFHVRLAFQCKQFLLQVIKYSNITNNPL